MIIIEPSKNPGFVSVSFHFPASEGVRSVHLVGDFNEWDPNKHPLKKINQKEWSTTLQLPSGYIYRFNYLVNGTEWLIDPDVPDTGPGPQFHQSSIIETDLPNQVPDQLPVETAPETKKNGAKQAQAPESPPAAFFDAKERLDRAKAEFHCGIDPSIALPERINHLQAAVDLDPFELRYRLALAQHKVEAGLSSGAIADFRAALELWPDQPALLLPLAETLLAADQADAAQEQLQKCAGLEAQWEPEWRARYQMVSAEAKICKAKSPEDWDKVLAALSQIEVVEENAGVFCEKCLKVVLEAQDKSLTEKVLALAAEKMKPNLCSHPAYRFLLEAACPPETIAEWPVPRTTPKQPEEIHRERLKELVWAYQLSSAPAAAGANGQSQVEKLFAWKAALEQTKNANQALRDGYIAQIDRLASQAYAEKKLDQAGLLWIEAQRLAPYHPPILQNLALTYTRLGDEHLSDWYWERLDKAWDLYGEMLPEATGFQRLRVQKHQAFISGAAEKLRLAQTWREQIELGEILAREAVRLLALRQLDFKTPDFRCGICNDDYLGQEQRLAALEAGSQSIKSWIRLAAEWQGLAENSELVAWRLKRVEEARQVCLSAEDEAGPSYAEELDAFKAHRKDTIDNFSLLLFNVALPLSEHIYEMTEADRRSFAPAARALLTFPYELVKPDLLKTVKGLPADVDLAGLTQNFAILPWAQPAQEALQQRQYDKALVYARELQQLLPDCLPAYILLYQCHSGLEQFDDALSAVQGALKHCNLDDEQREQFEEMAEQLDIARMRKRMAKGEKFLQQKNAAQAIEEFKKVVKEFPDHPYALFMLAQAYLQDCEILDARGVLTRAAQYAKPESELGQAVADLLEQATENGVDIILSQAVARMNAKEWGRAITILKKGEVLTPPDPRIAFYQAICLGWQRKTNMAEQKAREALAQCRGIEYAELRENIENFIPQITLLLIGSEMDNATRAMGKKHWKTALAELDEAIRKSPQAALPRYYKAICHFRLREWDEAEDAAKTAAAKVKKEDPELRERINSLLEEIPMAKVAKLMEQVQKDIKAERWEQALKTLKDVCSEAPTHPVAMFYEVLCLYNLERWDEAEKAAKHALRQVGASNETIREQLETMIDQIPFSRLNSLLKREKWEYVLRELDLILPENPDFEAGYFYRALAHLRLEHWDQAESCARVALQKVTSAVILEQVNEILRQLPLVRVNEGLKRAEKELEAGRWQQALDILNRIIDENRDHPVAWYYKAICELRLGRREAALQSARKGLGYAQGPEYASLRVKFEELIEAADMPQWKQDLEDAIKAMNSERWSDAKSLLDRVIYAQRTNSEAYYYRAICGYRILIDEISQAAKYGSLSYWEKEKFSEKLRDIEHDLDTARTYSHDSEMRKSIGGFSKVVKDLSNQLNRL